MKQEQIDRAVDYASDHCPSCNGDSPIAGCICHLLEQTFLAGAALTTPGAGVGREFSIGFIDWLRSMNFHLVQRLPEFNIDQKQTRERFIELLDQYQTLSTQSRSASQPGVTYEQAWEDYARGVQEGSYGTEKADDYDFKAGWNAGQQSPSLPPDGVQGLVEALEKIVKEGDDNKNYLKTVSCKMYEMAIAALTAYKNTKP